VAARRVLAAMLLLCNIAGCFRESLHISYSCVRHDALNMTVCLAVHTSLAFSSFFPLEDLRRSVRVVGGVCQLPTTTARSAINNVRTHAVSCCRCTLPSSLTALAYCSVYVLLPSGRLSSEAWSCLSLPKLSGWTSALAIAMDTSSEQRRRRHLGNRPSPPARARRPPSLIHVHVGRLTFILCQCLAGLRLSQHLVLATKLDDML